MTVRKSESGLGYDGQADGVRELKRKIKGPSKKDGKTIIGPGTYIPPDTGEGYADTTDEEVENINLEELYKIRQENKPLSSEKEHFHKIRNLVGGKPEESYPTNTQTSQITNSSQQWPTAQQYRDGVLHIMSNGTAEGTVITLNGKRLDVKIILNLNVI